jgi:hypothetical protein
MATATPYITISKSPSFSPNRKASVRASSTTSRPGGSRPAAVADAAVHRFQAPAAARSRFQPHRVRHLDFRRPLHVLPFLPYTHTRRSRRAIIVHWGFLSSIRVPRSNPSVELKREPQQPQGTKKNPARTQDCKPG